MWTYDHDYHEYDEELDYAYCETDTWDWWKFWFPMLLLALLGAAYYAEECYTRPPKTPILNTNYIQFVYYQNQPISTSGQQLVLHYSNGNDLIWRGEWKYGVIYAQFDTVKRFGKVWLCRRATALPPPTEDWEVIFK